MLCENCREYEARNEVSVSFGNEIRTLNVCDSCARLLTEMERVDELMKRYGHDPLKEAVERIVSDDARFAPDAYEFLYGACVKADREVYTHGEFRDYEAKELLEAIRKLALERFCKRAKATLQGWGVKSCSDCGEVFFNLVKQGSLRLPPKVIRLDFQNGFDFDEAFPES